MAPGSKPKHSSGTLAWIDGCRGRPAAHLVEQEAVFVHEQQPPVLHRPLCNQAPRLSGMFLQWSCGLCTYRALSHMATLPNVVLLQDHTPGWCQGPTSNAELHATAQPCTAAHITTCCARPQPFPCAVSGPHLQCRGPCHSPTPAQLLTSPPHKGRILEACQAALHAVPVQA